MTIKARSQKEKTSSSCRTSDDGIDIDTGKQSHYDHHDDDHEVSETEASSSSSSLSSSSGSESEPTSQRSKTIMKKKKKSRRQQQQQDDNDDGIERTNVVSRLKYRRQSSSQSCKSSRSRTGNSSGSSSSSSPVDTRSHHRSLSLMFVVGAVIVSSVLSFWFGRLVAVGRSSSTGTKLPPPLVGNADQQLQCSNNGNVVNLSSSSSSSSANEYECTVGIDSPTPTTASDDNSNHNNHVYDPSVVVQWKFRNNNNLHSAHHADYYRLSEEERQFDGGWHLLLELSNVDKETLECTKDMEEALIDIIDEIEEFEDPVHYQCTEVAVPTTAAVATHADNDDDEDDEEEDNVNVVCSAVSSNRHHVWMYSWPEHGVVSVDVFAAGEHGIRGLIPKIETIFEVDSSVILRENFIGTSKDDGGDDDNKHQNEKTITGPTVLWQQKHRGRTEGLSETRIAALGDLYMWPIGTTVDYKVEIATVQTMFQEIKVWDVIIPGLGTVESYKKSLLGDGSYESTHPELFEPDRIVYLDGLLQSRRSGDAHYHEALVHPLLLAHNNPKRVAIIGGGEGATLREVLKHSTIEKVVMIEIDEMMVNASRTYLPEWNDCSKIAGRADNCFDDPHTELYCEDAFAWFKRRFTDKDAIRPEDKFDVVIMDALDPQSMQEIVGALYTDNAFYRALNNALHHDGAIVAQIGEANSLDDCPSMFSDDQNCDGFVDGLEALNFTDMTEYQESGCGFFDPWSFHVATKANSTILRESWFDNEARINLKIRQRILPSVDGDSSLRHFDGATMKTYRHPSKAAREIFCLDPMTPESCLEDSGFNPEYGNIPVSQLSRTHDSMHSMVDVPKNAFVGLETIVQSIHIDSASNKILDKACTTELSSCLAASVRQYKKDFGFNGADGQILPSNPILKPKLSHPCKQQNVTILAELGHDHTGREVFSVLTPPFPAFPRNDTFYGYNSSFWSDYDLARRRQSPLKSAVNRFALDVQKGKELSEDAFCSLSRQHYADLT